MGSRPRTASPSALTDLARHYHDHAIVLYTGAGVSVGPVIDGCRYGIPVWMELLRSLVPHRRKASADDLPDDPWEAADRVCRLCGGKEALQKALRRVIQADHNYTSTHGQLAAEFLRGAPTLQAVAAFTGELSGRVASSTSEAEANRVHFRVEPNRRLEAILTSNYDCYLESGAASLFRRTLKPVTARGSLAGTLREIPVYHVHGFVPHPKRRKRKDLEPSVPDLILTSKSYERAWSRADVFGTTMSPQIHLLRHYVTLFVGFSFQDRYVCELLRQLRGESESRRRFHYALVSHSLVNKLTEGFFDELGVRPIPYERHEEIPALLGKVYEAGLGGKQRTAPLEIVEQKTHRGTSKSVVYPRGQHWDLLQRFWNCSVSGKWARPRALN